MTHAVPQTHSRTPADTRLTAIGTPARAARTDDRRTRYKTVFCLQNYAYDAGKMRHHISKAPHDHETLLLWRIRPFL